MAMSNIGIYVVAVLSICAVMFAGVAEGGCREKHMCCPGKNVTCKGYGPRINDYKTQKRSQICFCDEYCLETKDCCADYHEACKPVDCMAGEWQEWNKCSVGCGPGTRTRRKRIIVQPRNGGNDCGVYKESAFCHGSNCKRPRHVHSSHRHRETAKVIPAMYGSWRKSKLYDPFNDIRKNLFNHYSANSIIKRPAYCAHFEVTHTRGRCTMRNQYQGWTKMFTTGQTVCVECQPLAMKKQLGGRCSGDGIFLKETRWNAITMSGCHGKWKLKTEHRDCTCDPNSEMSFILL